MVGRVPATKSFNVLIVGSPQSGKTCVFKRFESGSSPEASLNTYEPSVSVQEATNMIASPDGTDKKIRLKMVDTPGEDKFRRQFTSSYYCSAHAVLLVYDMGNKSMWEKVEGVPNTPSCQEWVDEIEHCAGHPERCVRFLIGTKSDVPTRAVDMATITEFAEKNEMTHMELSAKYTNSCPCITSQIK